MSGWSTGLGDGSSTVHEVLQQKRLEDKCKLYASKLGTTHNSRKPILTNCQVSQHEDKPIEVQP